MNIILCGLPMCGKTTIGRLLSKKLNLNFLDIDQLIENEYASKKGTTLSARQIYREEGEPFFREMEKNQINSLKEVKGMVIALGGGSLTDPENLNLIRSIGDIFYLKASPDYLWKRVEQRGIPAYLNPNQPSEAFHAMANKRIPLYERVSDIIIEIENLSEEEIVDKLVEIRNRVHGE